MMQDSGFSEPLIEDPNTTVGAYPWEGNYGATRSYDTTNMSHMTNPVTAMVAPQKEATDEQFVGAGNDPEGADAGQNDAGGDADGENFGQDQGEQDRMESEYHSEGMSTGVKFGIGATAVALGLFGMVYVLSSN